MLFISDPLEAARVYRIPNRSRNGGGDFNLVSEMIRILRRNDLEEIRHTTEEALQSHLICFAAEKSRLNGGKIVELNDPSVRREVNKPRAEGGD